jgi:hypothetical protein
MMFWQRRQTCPALDVWRVAAFLHSRCCCGRYEEPDDRSKTSRQQSQLAATAICRQLAPWKWVALPQILNLTPPS